MILILHIAIALSSLILSAFLMFRPLRSLLTASYALVALTLGTGTVLILTGASVWHVCLSGVIYCTLVAGATEVTRRRLLATDAISE